MPTSTGKIEPQTPEERVLLKAVQRGEIRQEFLEALVDSLRGDTKEQISVALASPHEKAESAETIVAKAPVVYCHYPKNARERMDEPPLEFCKLILYSSGNVRVIDLKDIVKNYGKPQEVQFLQSARQHPIPCPPKLKAFLLENPDPEIHVGGWRPGNLPEFALFYLIGH